MEQLVDKKRQKHESSGLKYPRPIIECPECKSDVIICWGPVIRTYLRHMSKTVNKCNVSVESIEHLTAKKLLCEYIRDNGVVRVIHKDGSKSQVPELYSWKVEASHGSCRYDIGGYTKENSLEYGIEIWHKHKTTNIDPRTVKWIEVRAHDVLEVLDTIQTPKKITLYDHRDIHTKEQSKEIDTIDPEQMKCIEDEYAKLTGMRKCRRCSMHVISPGAPKFVLMCYECQDVCTPEEQEAVNALTGWRQCSICKHHSLHPKSPVHYNICGDCQHNANSNEQDEAKKVAGWRQCFSCSKHCLHPKTPDRYNVCRECQETITPENLSNARCAVGWKLCSRCKDYAIFPDSKYSKCIECSRLCTKEGCNGCVIPPCKTLCSQHTAPKKKKTTKSPVVLTERDDYRDGCEETYCNNCDRGTRSDWKTECLRCYLQRR